MLPGAPVEECGWKEKHRQWNNREKADNAMELCFQISEAAVTQVKSQGRGEKDSKAKKFEGFISGLKLWFHYFWYF